MIFYTSALNSLIVERELISAVLKYNDMYSQDLSEVKTLAGKGDSFYKVTINVEEIEK